MIKIFLLCMIQCLLLRKNNSCLFIDCNYYICVTRHLMELTKEEAAALKGEGGETLELAYRILVAIGEATDAERLVPIE